MNGDKDDAGAVAIEGPFALLVTARSENSITVRVTYMPGGEQTGSRFKWDVDNAPVEPMDFPTSINVHSCKITGLSSNTTYSFEVSGLKNQEESVYFKVVQAATEPAAAKPETPTNFNGFPTKDSIALTWNAVPNATLYKISHGLAPSGAVIKTEQSASPAFTIAGLNSNTEYFCEVRASNNNGDSGPRRINRKTLRVPPAPTDLKATPTNSSMYIEWRASQGAGYYLHRHGIDPGGAPQTSDTASLNATLTNLVRNTLYFIEVCGVNDNGTSPWTRITAKTEDGPPPPPKPGPVLLTSIGQHAMRANWSVPGSPSYRVSYGVDDDKHEVIDTLATDHLTVLLSGLAPGTRHFIDVRGYNAGMVSEPSSNTATTLVFEGPKNLSISEVTDESAVMVWDEGANYPGSVLYLIYLNDRLVDTISERCYVARGLTQSTSYDFKVCAKKPEGWLSGFTGSSFTTLRYEGVTICAPGYLRGHRLSATTASLDWENIYAACPLCPAALGFEVSVEGRAPFEVSAPPCEVTGLSTEKRYAVEVRARGGVNNLSAPSHTFFGAFPDRPGALRVTDVTSQSATLKWAAPAGNVPVFDYLLECNEQMTVSTRELGHTFNSMKPASTYTVKVRARTVDSTLSDPVQQVLTTLENGVPNAPTCLRFRRIGLVVMMEWDAPVNGPVPFDYQVVLTFTGGSASYDSVDTTIAPILLVARYQVSITGRNAVGHSLPLEAEMAV